MHRQLQTVQKFGPSLPRPVNRTFDQAKNLALNCSAAALAHPQAATTLTVNKLQRLFPLHTRRTLLLQWLLHTKVSPYNGYPSKGKQALTPIRYKAKGV